MPIRSRRHAKRRNGIEAHTIYVKESNWQFARDQLHRNGASGYIDTLLDRARRVTEDSVFKKESKRLRIENARLEGLVVKLGGDPNAK